MPMPTTARPIVFLSDFGFGNEWVGICHSVMARISPESPIIDLSHGIRRLEVGSGALLLADSMPYIAENAVVLAVVEPNVGKDREIAVETSSGRHLVGPDNGLLSLAWQAAGGVRAAVEITSPDVIQPVARRVPSRARHVLPCDGAPRRGHAAGAAGTEDRSRHARGLDRARTGGRARQDLLRGDRLQPLRQPPAQRAGSAPRRSGARRCAHAQDRGRLRIGRRAVAAARSPISSRAPTA